MGTSIRTATRNARIDEVNTALGAGALIRLYTTPVPADANAAATGVLLAELVCNAAGFGTSSGGTLTANPVAGQSYIARDSLADAGGTIGYARLCDSAGNCILQTDSIGLTGSGAKLIMSSLTVTVSQPVEIQSGTFADGNL